MPPDAMISISLPLYLASTIEAAVGIPHSLKKGSKRLRRLFSIFEKLVPPNPPMSTICTPTEESFEPTLDSSQTLLLSQ